MNPEELEVKFDLLIEQIKQTVKDAYLEGYYAGIDWDPSRTDDDRWNDSDAKKELDES